LPAGTAKGSGVVDRSTATTMSAAKGLDLTLVMALLLMLFWIVLTGSWDIQHLLVGAAVVALSLYIWVRLVPQPPPGVPGRSGAVIRRPGDVPARTWLAAVWLLAGYLVMMLGELVRANWRVALIVLNPKLPIAPQFYSYAPPVESPWARVLLANSVTLTPGTLTVELDENEFLVHALTPEAAQSLPGWSAERRIQRLEALINGEGEQ
jgi:multicomponent Na+:H+ antiporter subunit E